MFTTTIQKTVVDPDTGDELLYSFVTTGETAEQSDDDAGGRILAGGLWR